VGGGDKAHVGGAGGGDLPGVAEAVCGTEQHLVGAVALVPQRGASAVVQGGGVGAQDLPELVLPDLRPEVQEGVGDGDGEMEAEVADGRRMCRSKLNAGKPPGGRPTG